MIEISGTTRPDKVVRRFKRGTGMVTPITPVKDGLEVLQPGVSRLVPDHELVVAQPHRFRPCDRSDRATAERMRQLTRSSGRTARASKLDGYGLGPPRQQARPSWEP